ncbi:hypothetical protein MT881_002362 [Enterococcus faecium]|nr:hypothetical protein [Enterococcus faecium]
MEKENDSHYKIHKIAADALLNARQTARKCEINDDVKCRVGFDRESVEGKTIVTYMVAVEIPKDKEGLLWKVDEKTSG